MSLIKVILINNTVCMDVQINFIYAFYTSMQQPPSQQLLMAPSDISTTIGFSVMSTRRADMEIKLFYGYSLYNVT